MKFYWEAIESETYPNSGELTYRAKVFGGWIVRTIEWHTKPTDVQSESSVFIPDPEHLWEIEEE